MLDVCVTKHVTFLTEGVFIHVKMDILFITSSLLSMFCDITNNKNGL